MFSSVNNPCDQAYELDRDNPIAGGIIGWWPGKGSNRHARFDLSGYGNDVVAPTAARTPNIAASTHGSVADYDGTNDIHTAGNISTFEGIPAITVSSWWYIHTLSSHRAVVGQYWDGTDRSWFFENNNTILRWLVATDTSNANNEANYSLAGGVGGLWLHIVGTWDSATNGLVLYRDGAQVATATSSGNTVRANTAEFTIGANHYAGTYRHCYDGLVGETTIWNRALNATEVQSLYQDPYQLRRSTVPNWLPYVPAAPVGGTTGHGLSSIESGDTYLAGSVSQGLHQIESGITA